MVEAKPPRPTVLYLSEPNGASFDLPLYWLQQRADVQVIAGLSAVRGCCSDLRPLLVILAHSYPGQFPAGTDVELMRLFPMCRVIHLLREWCDGEMRGDRPSPGTTSIHWYHWRSQFEADWHAWQRGDCPSWGMAPTAADEDRFALRGRNLGLHDGFAVGIVTACWESNLALTDAVKAIGFQAVTLSNLESDETAALSLVLWDEACAPRAKAIPLREVVRNVAPVPVIALASFARATEFEAAHQAGAIETLAKPFSLHDLSWLLHYHLPSCLPELAVGAPAA